MNSLISYLFMNLRSNYVYCIYNCCQENMFILIISFAKKFLLFILLENIDSQWNYFVFNLTELKIHSPACVKQNQNRLIHKEASPALLFRGNLVWRKMRK